MDFVVIGTGLGAFLVLAGYMLRWLPARRAEPDQLGMERPEQSDSHHFAGTVLVGGVIILAFTFAALVLGLSNHSGLIVTFVSVLFVVAVIGSQYLRFKQERERGPAPVATKRIAPVRRTPETQSPPQPRSNPTRPTNAAPEPSRYVRSAPSATPDLSPRQPESNGTQPQPAAQSVIPLDEDDVDPAPRLVRPPRPAAKPIVTGTNSGKAVRPVGQAARQSGLPPENGTAQDEPADATDEENNQD